MPYLFTVTTCLTIPPAKLTSFERQEKTTLSSENYFQSDMIKILFKNHFITR